MVSALILGWSFRVLCSWLFSLRAPWSSHSSRSSHSERSEESAFCSQADRKSRSLAPLGMTSQEGTSARDDKSRVHIRRLDVDGGEPAVLAANDLKLNDLSRRQRLAPRLLLVDDLTPVQVDITLAGLGAFGNGEPVTAQGEEEF